jgi:hypothetical protein
MLAELPRPILYSFRRCPYAIRARLALLLAGNHQAHRGPQPNLGKTSSASSSPKRYAPELLAEPVLVLVG